ncbi:HalD/BesD family halogenase [Streptomyces sp. CA-251247]|uniref:HalD/BesD family halogenase n=1 Tax=Streptomyces sp. CA-251247 TaxID=3240062 RepID=UPI003D8A64B6
MLSLPDFTPVLRDRFTVDGYLPLPGLVPPDALQVLDGEVRRLEKLAVRRDFAMECMDDSPRHMTTLGGHVIAQESPLKHPGVRRTVLNLAYTTPDRQQPTTPSASELY